MKNTAYFLLVLLFVVVLFSLCACAPVSQGSAATVSVATASADAANAEQGSAAMESIEQGSAATVSAEHGRAATVSAEHVGEPLDWSETRSDNVIPSVNYSSVAAMLKGVSSGITREKFQEIEEHEYDKGAFRSYIEGLRRDKATYIPHIGGDLLELRNETGYDAISVFPSELYGKPWTCYFPDKDKTGVFCVFMMLLDEDIVAEANKNGAPWLMRQMNPNGTNEGVYPYPLYDKITEKDISLMNRTGRALIGQFDDDPRNYVHFVYDNIFLRIITMPGSAGENWMSGLSFKKISLDAPIVDTAPMSSEEKVEMMFTLDNVFYAVNGEARILDVAPALNEGRTLLPIRFVAEPLGAVVDWEDAEEMVIVTLVGKKIELKIGDNTAKVNGANVKIDLGNDNVKPLVISDRTMLPLRFVAETLGCNVEWFEETREILVTYPK